MLRLALALLVAFIVGVVVTRLTVTDGLSQFEGRERALANQALEASYLMTDNPLLANAIVARRVVLVEPEPEGECTDPGFEVNGAYPGHKASVRCYTLFRVPIARVSVTCGGAIYGLTMGLDA